MAMPMLSAAPVSTEATARKLRDRMSGIVARLESEANARVAKRQPLELIWIEDLQQYHGRYDDRTEANLSKGQRSKLFNNITRTKTDGMSARLMDLLFPTDEKNWGIQPTPVPELTRQADQAVKQARAKAEAAKDAQKQAIAAQEGADPAQAATAANAAQQATQEADSAQQAAALLTAQVEEGRRRADLMAEEIDDQLKQSRYHAAMRDLIEDACKIGTGVCKGPVTGDHVRKGWKNRPVMEPVVGPDGKPQIGPDGKPAMRPRTGPDGAAATEYFLDHGGSDGFSPSMRWVDVWSFFPDMDAKSVEDGEGVFERHLLNEKRLRRLAKLPGFDKDAIRRLLEAKPRGAAPSYLATLRNLTGDKAATTSDLYHCWEYSGPLKAEDMRDLALAMGDEATIGDIGEVDPLEETNAIVWFCQGELLKLSIYPFDSGECMYSVFNLAKDETSIFGSGMPSIIRDPQKASNAAFRALMDNAGLSSGPQVVIAQHLIEPADGDWTITPRKVWLAKEGLPRDKRAMDVFDIPTRQIEYVNIMVLCKQLADDMASMPAIAQGEQSTNPNETYGGQALKMNAANVSFRRIVKSFDDDVTTPNIRRFYDANMQFNPKEEIKGDYEVDARGSSVLLVRELQSQSLMWVAMNLGAHPVFGPMLKNRDVLRKIFQTMLIPASEVVLSDEEIDAIIASADAQRQQADAAGAIKAAELNAQLDIATINADSRVKVAELQRETALIGYATTGNIAVDKLEAMLTDKREERASKERSLLVEAGVAATTGEHAGGSI